MEKRLIDADALIEFIENRYYITWKDDYEGGIKDACTDILEKISKMPTIDAVEVVRCKDCKWWNTDFLPQDCGWCEKSGNEHGRLADWFCKDGERKEE